MYKVCAAARTRVDEEESDWHRENGLEYAWRVDGNHSYERRNLARE